jgi:hypothetical protein
MNDETALKIIENYFESAAEPEQLAEALAYLETAPSAQSRLGTLYRTLLEPGGISCETSRELMPFYQDEITRLALSLEEKRSFLVHLVQCPECAEDYLDLRNFERELEIEPDFVIPSFSIPKAALNYKKANWPELLGSRLKKIKDTLKELQVNISFVPEPRFAFKPNPQIQTATQIEELMLFDRPLATRIELKVQVKALDPHGNKCKVLVILIGPAITNRPNGHLVILRFAQVELEQFSDFQGQTIFEEIPIEALSVATLEIKTVFLN